MNEPINLVSLERENLFSTLTQEWGKYFWHNTVCPKIADMEVKLNHF